MLGKKKKSYNIILEKTIKKEIHDLAEKEERSDSWYINNVLKKHLKEKGIVIEDAEDEDN